MPILGGAAESSGNGSIPGSYVGIATKQISLQRNTLALATTNSRNHRRVVLPSNEAPLRRESSHRSIRCHTIHQRGHPMTFTASIVRACKMLIATSFALAALSTAAQAYTPEQEQMCTGDAMRLCSSEIPDVERVTACMVQKRAQLSDGCKAVFQYVPRRRHAA